MLACENKPHQMPSTGRRGGVEGFIQYDNLKNEIVVVSSGDIVIFAGAWHHGLFWASYSELEVQ